jgi:hypothetical protein
MENGPLLSELFYLGIASHTSRHIYLILVNTFITTLPEDTVRGENYFVHLFHLRGVKVLPFYFL